MEKTVLKRGLSTPRVDKATWSQGSQANEGKFLVNLPQDQVTMFTIVQKENTEEADL